VTSSLERANLFYSSGLGRSNHQPITLETVNGQLRVHEGGIPVASLPPVTLSLDPSETLRLREIHDRVAGKLVIYATMVAATAPTPAEQARLEAQTASRRVRLGRDFRDLIRILDRALGIQVSEYFRTRARERSSEVVTA
jgi:hypothetical protein